VKVPVKGLRRSQLGDEPLIDSGAPGSMDGPEHYRMAEWMDGHRTVLNLFALSRGRVQIRPLR
jgi:hypothetical protein